MTTSLRAIIDAITYCRPDYVSSLPSEGSIMESDTSSIKRTSQTTIRGIPERLSFDKIIQHETCPPCTTLDFYNYLNNKVHCAENLQFFLWLRDYIHRFNSPSRPLEVGNITTWTHAQQEEAIHRFQKQITASKIKMSPAVKEIFEGTDFADNAKTRMRGNSAATEATNNTSASTLVGAMPTPWESFDKETREKPRASENATAGITAQEERDTAIARAGYAKAGLHYPFFHPTFRREIESTIATYIVESAPRELNLSAAERFAVLSALQRTPHPSAFHFIGASIEAALRQQHHPNFILDAICNGNRPRVLFARFLGAALILLGFVLVVLLSLSDRPRRFRALAAIFWVLGIATSIAAAKGMCVVLHGMHHRHVRPWELFQANGELGVNDVLEPRGTAANDITTQYWVERYAKRNLVRKIFDREVWIQEPALRQIQDKIFIQAMLVSVLISVVLAVVWVVAVPKMVMI